MENLIKIFEVYPEEAIKIATAPDDPHHHDFEELLIGTEGGLEHFIDFKSEVIDAPYISFVTKGKMHRLIPKVIDGKCHVRGIRFKSEFIPDTVFHLYNLFHNNANIVFKPGRCFDRLVVLFDMMKDEMSEPIPDLRVVKLLLSALFMMLESEHDRPASPNVSESTNATTFSNFLRILEENFRRSEGVEFYAERLFMTSRNLNHITQKTVQQSVSELIETRKLIEAKNLLISTDKPISEIAFDLGYQEKSYFSKVFKKKSGQTPSEFRDEIKSMI